MSFPLLSRRTALLTPSWARNELWRRARAVPSLDLRFAESKSLVDATTGANLVTFTRSSTGTYIDSDGLIKTAATNEARFDHNPTTGESLGLLVEEQRTNSIRNNTMVGAVAGTPGTLPTNWAVGGFAGLTREIVGTGSYNGVTYIDIKFSGTSAGTFGDLYFEVLSTISAGNSQIWTQSVWLQVVAGSLTGITSSGLNCIQYDSVPTAVGSTTNGAMSASIGTDWQRLSRSHTTNNASIASIRPYIAFGITNGASINITLRIGLPQLEQGAFATSVIPTTNATATRSADVASITGAAFSSWYRQDEGTVFVDVARPPAVTGSYPNIVNIDNGTSSNKIHIYCLDYALRYTHGIITGGVSQVPFNQSSSVAANSFNKLAVGLKFNDTVFAADSTVVNTDNSVTLPIVSRLDLAGSDTRTIRRLTYWPQRLPNTTLQAITL